MKDIHEMKILIVDDDKVCIAFNKSILGKNGYKEIQTAMSGEEGLKSVKEDPPDVILLDVIMPGMNGYEVCRKVRANEATRHIPIIMVTSGDESGDQDSSIKNSFEAGATDYISKPPKSVVLSSRLESALAIKYTHDQLKEEIHKRKQEEKATREALEKLKKTQSYLLQSEKMASIGQLATGVAHEINNPVGFVNSNLGSRNKYSDKVLELLKRYEEGLAVIKDNGSKEVTSFYEEMEELKKKLKIDFIMRDLQKVIADSLEGTQRIKKIVADLKSFSRVDQAEFKHDDINEGLKSTLNVVWNELKYKCTVEKDFGDLPKIYCNLGQLNQVFMNLLVNAAQAIEEKGTIKISTRHVNGKSEGGDTGKDYIEIKISDTGKGISEDKLNRIFEPFFTTKDVGKGTGLGLSIAYDIIQKHKGEIKVASEVGKGTSFTIQLPIMEGEDGT